MELQEGEFNKILLLVMQKGVSNTDLSMFSDEIKTRLLKKAAEEFFNNRNYTEAINAYKLLGDNDKLNKLGDSFLKAGLLSNAFNVYQAANNEVMVRFIKQNFDEKEYDTKLYL